MALVITLKVGESAMVGQSRLTMVSIGEGTHTLTCDVKGSPKTFTVSASGWTQLFNGCKARVPLGDPRSGGGRIQIDAPMFVISRIRKGNDHEFG